MENTQQNNDSARGELIANHKIHGKEAKAYARCIEIALYHVEQTIEALEGTENHPAATNSDEKQSAKWLNRLHSFEPGMAARVRRGYNEFDASIVESESI